MNVCKLCREEAELQKSHLLPKSVYRVISDLDVNGNSQPIKIDEARRSAVKTNEQFTEMLLCSRCEQRFNKFGETIIGRLWAIKSSFPLLSKVNNLGISEDDGHTQIFDITELPKEEIEGLYYFAVSFIWRNYVWDWSRTRSEEKKIPLGEKYAEIFRQYLLGGSRPNNSYLYVILDTGKNPVRQASLPMAYKQKGYTTYRFEMPGIGFCLMVGGQVELEILEIFRAKKSNLLIIGQNYRDSDNHKGLVKMAKNIEVKGVLAKNAITL